MKTSIDFLQEALKNAQSSVEHWTLLTNDAEKSVAECRKNLTSVQMQTAEIASAIGLLEHIRDKGVTP